MRLEDLKLGDKLRCKVTGYIGIATAKTTFINGCTQVLIASKVGKDNKINEEVGIDIQSLELVVKKKVKIEKERVGGAMTRNFVRRNF